jgi:hypothetical protein
MASRVKLKTNTPLEQKYTVVQSKRTGKKYLAKEEHARRLQKKNTHAILSKEGEANFDKAKTKVIDKHQ